MRFDLQFFGGNGSSSGINKKGGGGRKNDVLSQLNADDLTQLERAKATYDKLHKVLFEPYVYDKKSQETADNLKKVLNTGTLGAVKEALNKLKKK